MSDGFDYNDAGLQHKKVPKPEDTILQEQEEARISATTEGESLALSPTFLNSTGFLGRGNGAVRTAAIVQMQGTQGNRAVQRAIHRSVSLPVQRDEDTPWYRRAWNSVSNTASDAAHRMSNTVNEAEQGISQFAHNVSSEAPGMLGTGILGMGVGAQGHIDNLMAQQMADNERTHDHGFLHTVGGLFNRERQSEARAAGNIGSMEQSAEHAETWAADRLAGGAHWLADQVSNVPLVGNAAQMGAGLVDSSAHGAAGGARALTRAAGGMGQMAANPIGAVEHGWQMAENNPLLNMLPINPFRTAHGVADVARGGSISSAANHWLNPSSAQADSTRAVTDMVGGAVHPGIEAIRHGDISGGLVDIGTSLELTFDVGGEGGAGAAERASASETGLARGMEGGVHSPIEGVPAEGASGGAGAGAAPVRTPGEPPTVAADTPVPSTPAASAAPQPTAQPAPQPVMQMPAVPADLTPNMPQPARWQAGPVGTPPISNPALEMPAVSPADAASGRMPRDWGTYAVGRGRLPGHVGEMPAVSPAQVRRAEPAGFSNNAGAISPRSSAAVTPAPAPASVTPVDALARTAEMPRAVDPVAPTVEAPNPFASTAEMPTHTPTLPGTGPGGGRQTLPGTGPGGGRQTLPGIGTPPGRSTLPGVGAPPIPSVDPFAPTIEMPAMPAPGRTPTIPGVGAPPTRQTLPGLGTPPGRSTLSGIGTPLEPVDPFAPTAEMPLQGGTPNTPSAPGPTPEPLQQPNHGLAEDPNDIAQANEGAYNPIEHSPANDPAPRPKIHYSDNPNDFNRLPDFARGLMDIGDVDALREVLQGHGLDVGQYLRDYGLMED